MKRICLGWDHLETRPATPEERDFVEGLVRKATSRSRRFRIGLSLCGLIWAILVLAATLTDSQSPSLFLFPMICITGWTVLHALDARRRERFLLACLPTQNVDVYGEVIKSSEVEVGDEALDELQADLSKEIEVMRLTVLPETGLLIKHADGFATKVTRVETQTVTPPPQPKSEPNRFPAMLLHRHVREANCRLLTPQEQVELATLRKIVTPNPEHIDIVALTICILGGLAGSWDGGSPWLWPAILAELATLGLYASRWRPQMRLRRDVLAGIVAQVQEDGPLVEVLPFSGRVWSIDGEPAPFRRISAYPSVL